MEFVCQSDRMEIIEFTGIARSGHHAMMNWFFKNMVDFEYHNEWQVTVFGDCGWTHWNDATIFYEQCLNVMDTLNKPNILSISYDNEFWDYSHINHSNSPFNRGVFKGWEYTRTHKILFIRDFYNNLVSRINMFHNRNEPRAFYDEKFLEIWKNHAKACLEGKVNFIKYEDWLQNKDKRVELLDKFNVKERFDNTQVSGTHSSFGDSKNYLNRFDANLIPEHIKEIIRKDNELHYLIGKMGYDYKEI